MPPLTEEAQSILMGQAREALDRGVRQMPPAEEPVDLPAALMEPRGAFVTLRKQGRLRGCIGQILGERPLVHVVRECAVEAALGDPRFPPVKPEELPALHIEISVLSAPEVVTPWQIEIGRHGLMISYGRRRGLLLPQVAVEWQWNRERFLEETCLKAGLPRDAWRTGARIESFTAQIFSEPLEAVTPGTPESPSPYSNPRKES